MKKKKTVELNRDERRMFALLKSRMRHEPSGNYRIQQLTIETGMNRTKLQQGFYFLFGVPIHAYLLLQRLAQAKKLLRQTNLPVKAVSVQSGFHSEKYFFRFFKENTSLTPITYRNRNKRPRS